MFHKVESGKLKLLAMISDRVVFQPGEVIYEQDAPSDAVYIVLEGQYKVSLHTAAGTIDFAQHVRGALLGEAGVLCDQRRMVTITAETSVVALRVDREDFLQLLEESQPFNHAVMRELGRQIMDLNNICAQLVQRLPHGAAGVDASVSVAAPH
ncbi:Crp/Fnr family transcriptional regulator [Ancylobacter mangrovi]|uniref:Crp/Fnr family transcriptional regulator n=1 Tax=Ancylobacter mangrovi TaxID=2972472 RepID=A0A9X2PHA2_9HYPH|nr:Crp/Fnr family transcriptional regulator [Ancylobacter mangrovi]MCS0497071.1 Crp/Fnr family transcriptional regulator [Ancylobacter mangrovi]MCS0503441.1 Crp/Fnr family transcriptional regulator [Ancylobacter mangrovi]